MRTIALSAVLIAATVWADGEDSTMALGRGEISSFKAPGVTRVELADNSVLTATVGDGKLKLRGKAIGHSDLIAFKGTAEVAHFTVTVEGEQPASIGLTAIELKVGTSANLVIDGVDKATARDPKLAEARVARPGSVTVTAKAAGDVTVELSVRGERQNLLVKVVP